MFARGLLLLLLGCNHAPLAAPEDLRSSTLGAGDLGCIGASQGCSSGQCCAGLYCRILHDATICIDQCAPSGYPCVTGADCCIGSCTVPRGGFEPSCE